ncbi:MAG: hypothetical protein AB7F64_01805 [Gammaproteobacteria bacterium]
MFKSTDKKVEKLKLTDEQVKNLISLVIRYKTFQAQKPNGTNQELSEEVLKPSLLQYSCLIENEDSKRLGAHLEWLYDQSEENLNLVKIGCSNESAVKSELSKIQIFLCNISLFLKMTLLQENDTVQYFIEFTEQQEEASKQFWTPIFDSWKLEASELNKQIAFFNQSVAEKIRDGHATDTEWLTDRDIERILKAVNCPLPVFIGPFDSVILGMKLHLARRDWTDQTNPLYVPCLVNLTNVSGSGLHWVYLLFIIQKNTNGKINVKTIYGDQKSLWQKERIKSVIRDSLNYQEHPVDSTVSNLRSIVAFPRAKRTFEIINTSEQNEGWSCGYRAIWSLLTRLKKEGIPYEHPILACGSVKELQGFIYDILVRSLVSEESALAGVKIDDLNLLEQLHKSDFDNDSGVGIELHDASARHEKTEFTEDRSAQESSVESIPQDISQGVIDLAAVVKGNKILLELFDLIKGWKEQKINHLKIINFIKLEFFHGDFFIQALSELSELVTFECLDDRNNEQVNKLLKEAKAIIARNKFLKQCDAEKCNIESLWGRAAYFILLHYHKTYPDTNELFYPDMCQKADNKSDDVTHFILEMGVRGFVEVLKGLQKCGSRSPFKTLHLKMPAGSYKADFENYITTLKDFYNHIDNLLYSINCIVFHVSGNEEDVFLEITEFIKSVRRASMETVKIHLENDEQLNNLSVQLDHLSRFIKMTQSNRHVFVRVGDAERELGVSPPVIYLYEEESVSEPEEEVFLEDLAYDSADTKKHLTYNQVLVDLKNYEAGWFVSGIRNNFAIILKSELEQIASQAISIDEKIKQAIDKITSIRGLINFMDEEYNRSHLFKRGSISGNRFLTLLNNAIFCLNNALNTSNQQHTKLDV